MKMAYTVSRATRGAIVAMLLGGSIVPSTPAAAAAGDSTAGRALFAARCMACHSLHPTRKPGPMLLGVYGRPAGSVPGYHYSTALKDAPITWNAANLDRWLAGPPAFIPGVNMQAQVDSAQDRQNIIAYLKTLNPATLKQNASAAGK